MKLDHFSNRFELIDKQARIKPKFLSYEGAYVSLMRGSWIRLNFLFLNVIALRENCGIFANRMSLAN